MKTLILAALVCFGWSAAHAAPSMRIDNSFTFHTEEVVTKSGKNIGASSVFAFIVVKDGRKAAVCGGYISTINQDIKQFMSRSSVLVGDAKVKGNSGHFTRFPSKTTDIMKVLKAVREKKDPAPFFVLSKSEINSLYGKIVPCRKGVKWRNSFAGQKPRIVLRKNITVFTR